MVTIEEGEGQSVGRGVYLRGAREAWMDWCAAKKEPTRERALEIIAAELSRGVANTLGETKVRNYADGSLNDRLSFLVWDLTENGRGALEYHVNTGFMDNLLQQAANIISGMWARAPGIKIGREWIYPPEMGKVRGSGMEGITRMSKETREQWVTNWIRQTLITLRCARSIKGVDWPFIRRALLRLIREARAAWQAAESVAAD